MKCFLYIIILLFSAKISCSQDIHFSQNFIIPINLNPAFIGGFEHGDYKVSSQRRSQWKSVTKPFSTFNTSFEAKNIFNRWGLGIQFFNDRAGDANLSINQINIGLSRDFKTNQNQYIHIGSYIGGGQKSIDYSNLYFEETENLLNENLLFSDISIGIAYRSYVKKRFWLTIGASAFHINTPNISFIENNNEKLHVRSNYYGKISYKKNEKINIISDVAFTKQSSSKEILLGIRPEFYTNNIILIPSFYHRLKDAMIIGFGVKKDNILANISYDINISKLSPASNYKGGFEFGLSYIWSKNKPKVPEKIKREQCPIYL